MEGDAVHHDGGAVKIPLFETYAEGYNSATLGFRMSQNRIAPLAFSYLIEHGNFARVVELGTHTGGLTALLGVHCKNVKAELHTFDWDHRALLYADWFNLLGVTAHLLDIFSPDGETLIRELIASQGRTLLLCDGGDKRREFSLFASSLKDGDVIGAHDCRNDLPYWSWQEISEANVREACVQNHLVPVEHAGLFTEAAWIMKTKKPHQ